MDPLLPLLLQPLCPTQKDAIFSFFQTLCSGALVATVGPQVFGVPISTKAALKGLFSRLLAYVYWIVIGSVAFFGVFKGVVLP